MFGARGCRRSEHTVVFEQEGKGSPSGVEECTAQSMNIPHCVDVLGKRAQQVGAEWRMNKSKLWRCVIIEAGG
jgi:hypothetical protein